MPTSVKKRKGGIWYQRGFDSADREKLVKGEESPKQKIASVGYTCGFALYRYPQKEKDFMRGYWDSIEAQRNKKAVV